MAAATIKIEIPMQIIDNMNPGLDQVTKKLNKLERAVVEASNQVMDAAKSKANVFLKSSEQISRFDKAIEKTQRDLIKMVREDYGISLELFDLVTPILSRIKNSLNGTTGKAWKVTVSAIDQVTEPINKILNVFKNLNFNNGGEVFEMKISIKDNMDNLKKSLEFDATQVQFSQNTSKETKGLFDESGGWVHKGCFKRYRFKFHK